MKVEPPGRKDIKDGCEGVCARKDFAGGYVWIARWSLAVRGEDRSVEEQMNGKPLVDMVADEWIKERKSVSG